MIHWVVMFLIWFSALLVPEQYLQLTMRLLVLTVLCLMTFRWDFQKSLPPPGKPNTIQKVTDVLIYTNIMIIGYHLAVPDITVLGILMSILPDINLHA
jgi:hypothetical protein